MSPNISVIPVELRLITLSEMPHIQGVPPTLIIFQRDLKFFFLIMGIKGAVLNEQSDKNLLAESVIYGKGP